MSKLRSVVFMVGLLAASSVYAQTAMAVEQQNAIVQRHCAVCHNDAAKNGGLSLSRFDAATVAPSLAAMMISKLAGGLPLQTVKSAASDAAADAALGKELMGGAINAAGARPPALAEIKALTAALAAKAAAPQEWHVVRNEDVASRMAMTTVSVLREMRRTEQMAESYRLVLTCNDTSREAEMQLTWSPQPKIGTFAVAADGKARGTFKVDGAEKMGNGIGKSNGLAAFRLPIAALPSRSLVVSELFPNETVEFSFSDLTPAARASLAPCFPGTL